MKRFAFYFSVSLLTHAIGLAAVFVIGFLPNVITLPENIPAVAEDFDARDIITVETPQSYIHEPSLKYNYGGGSGGKYGDAYGYRSSDGQEVIARVLYCETLREIRKTLNKRIAKARRIIERTRNDKNHDGRLEERIVIINPPNKNGTETVSVLWYGGGDIVVLIDAPTLEAALEYEQSDVFRF